MFTRKTSVTHAAAPLSVALALACLPMLTVALTAFDDLCGATIVEDLKLDHDLTCVGNGLNVGADGIKIDLNGHTITGSDTGAGINVIVHANVSISGGTIRNFGAGVLTNTSTEIVIKQMEFVENIDGIDLQAGSSGNTIKQNDFRDRNTLELNTCGLKGPVSGNTVEDNRFEANGADSCT